MKKGDKVYLVVPFDKPGEVNGTDYIVQARTLVVASDKQLRLDSYFSFHCGLVFKPGDMGREFYASPREAVDAFERGHKQAVERKQRELKSAQENYMEAAQWANSWREEHVGC